MGQIDQKSPLLKILKRSPKILSFAYIESHSFFQKVCLESHYLKNLVFTTFLEDGLF